MVAKCYIACLFALLAFAHSADKEINQKDADDYLQQFGYLSGRQRSGSATQRSLARTRAISAFQDFAGLPVTGELDDATKRKMNEPRCGMKDSARLTRGFAKWTKWTLKWSLDKPTSQIDSNRVKNAIRQAFAVWSEIVPMNFTEVSPGSAADMKFEFASQNHGCGNSFDGEGGVLAHAFFPKDGRLHFDDQERWAFEDAAKVQQGYTDLLSVTIHELGHSLGLPHSKEEDAIMYPYYRAPDLVNGKLKQFQLSKFDINDIQKIYGPRAGATPRPAEVKPPGGPSTGTACGVVSAAATASDGSVYFFFQNSNIGWKKSSVNAPANSGTRFYVDKKFLGAPNNGITTAFYHNGDKMMYLLQGRRVFGYSFDEEFNLESGYPKDLPNTVLFTPEGAMVWEGNGHQLLFSGEQFANWDSTSNESTWKGKISDYFGKFPGKASFAVGNQLYFVDGANVSIFDFRDKKVVGTKALNSVITC